MANTLGTAYVQIKPTTKGITGELESELSGSADKAGASAGAGLASKLKGALLAAGIGKALVDVTKHALEAGGAMQQSFGGLDTIYGEASGKAKEFAMQAAEMGISANDYAEQAVSFGASLKQAFGGDTEKAVEAANTAIMDMTDNAAKMGTPIENIQSAYQGFAKQNYTMLDNLKLGYGGTKTEMERLLKDAEKISGVKYDISNLGDVYDAIHVVQGELGLTGVAADEAKTTLTGSLGAMKASAENFLATLTTGGDISGPLTQLITSVGNFLINNLVPMLTNIVTSVPAVLSSLFTTLAPQIGQAFNTAMAAAPGIIESGTQMINNLVNGILQGLPEFIQQAFSLLTQFVGAIMDNLPALWESGVSIILNLINGIIQNLPTIVTTGYSAMAEFLASIGEKLPDILQKGFELLGELAAGIIEAIPDLLAKLPEVFDGIKSAFEGFDWIGIGKNIIDGIANGIKNFAKTVWDAAKSAGKGILDAFGGFLRIGSPSKLMADEIGRWIPAGIAEGIRDNMDTLTSAIDTAGAYGSVYMSGAYTPGETYNAGAEIVDAISNAGNNANVNVNVTLQGDAGKLFRVIEKTNTRRTKATNYNVLGYGG
jgi:phage-related protein